MNNREFLSELSKRTAVQGKVTDQAVKDLIEAITARLCDGDIVSVSGFGTFEVKKKMERVSVNPKTGKRMLVPPKLTVSYRPSLLLKERFK